MKYYSLPDDLENQQKFGHFFSNIEEGEFKEIIKINMEHFQLISNKYVKSENEKNGVYKFYFDLVKGDASLSFSED